MANKNEQNLEPRVAALETGLDRLAEDVKDLAGIVRSQGATMEGEIQKLVVAVTQASGPRKTDWSTIISAIFLIMAIGSAVFWPLNQTVQDSKYQIQQMDQAFHEHQQLKLHPVGDVMITDMGARLEKASTDNKTAILDLDKKLQRESELLVAELKTQIANISTKYDKEIQNLGERLISRVNEYDNLMHSQTAKDLDELRMWRLKGMGLCDKNGSPITISPILPHSPNISPNHPAEPNK